MRLICKVIRDGLCVTERIISPDGTQVWEGDKWVVIERDQQHLPLSVTSDTEVVVDLCNECKIVNDRKPEGFSGYMKCASCFSKEQEMRTQEITAPSPSIVPNQVIQPGFNIMQPMQETAPPRMIITNQNRRKFPNSKTSLLASILGVWCIITLVIIILIVEQEEEFSLEYTQATAFIYIESIQVDNGEANRMFEVDVFYDERNRYEFRTGDECDALEYYDSPRTYYLEEFCVFNYADPFVDEVTFGACAQYVASDRYYDIYSSADSVPSCVKAESSILNPTLNPSYGLENDCSYDGELIDDNLSIAKFVSFSGLDDGDSNSYNAEIDFTLSFVLTYECTI